MRKRLKNALIPHSGNGRHPHIFRKKGVAWTLTVTFGLQGLVLIAAFFLPKIGTQLASVLPSVVTMLTNEARAEVSLPALQTNAVLARAAQAKAEDMAARGYFAHQSPDGRQPWDWISAAGYQYQVAGENLAVNFHDSEDVVRAWQNSPTHNMNLLGPRYSEIGIGMAEGEYKGRKAVFVVQMFASPRQLASIPSPIPASPAPTQQIAEVEAPVLGAETSVGEEKPSVITRVASSPRTYSMYVYSALATALMLILILGLTPLYDKPHPRAALNGVLVVAIIAGIMIVDERLLVTPIEVPTDSQNAAAVLSL